MKPQEKPVILVVDNHWVLGKLMTSGQRVLDILNQSTTDFLTLYDAKVFASTNRKACIAELPDTVVPKVKLSLLIIPTEKFEVSRSGRAHAIIEKRKSSSFAIVADYSVQGTVHLTTRACDSLYALTNGLGNFSPSLRQPSPDREWSRCLQRRCWRINRLSLASAVANPRQTRCSENP